MNKTQLLEATGVAVREEVNAEAVAKRLVAEATNAIDSTSPGNTKAARWITNCR
jgi:hypothetical protein